VGEPHVVGGFFDEHTVYPITIRDFNNEPRPIHIHRRYTDFLNFYNEMVRAYPQCLVPPIPEQTVAALLDEEVVEQRARELQWFLNALSNHKHLASIPHLEIFFKTPSDNSSELLSSLVALNAKLFPKDSRLEQPLMVELENEIAPVLSFFSSFFNSSAPAVATSDSTADDRELQLLKNLLGYAEGSLDKLQSVAEKSADVSDGHHKYSVAWFDVAYEQRDEPQEYMGTELLRLLKACTLTARLTKEQKDTMKEQLWEPLRFYSRCATGLTTLFKRHEAALLELKRLSKVNPPLPSSLIDEERKKLDVRREAILDECEDYQRNKLKDFKMLVRNLALTNIQQEKRKEDLWTRLKVRLENRLPLEPNFRFLPSLSPDSIQSRQNNTPSSSQPIR
jgi:hypothetical protein